MITDKFIILTAGRSGSTYLQRLLNSHPAVTCYDEIFNVTNKSENSFYSFCQRVYPKLSFLFLRGKFSGSSFNFPLTHLFRQYIKFLYKNPSGDKIGFKVIYHQLLYYYPLVDWLEKNSIPIIHLQRRNPLKAVLSHAKAKHTGVYVSTSETTLAFEKITVDPQVILDELALAENQKKSCDPIIQNHPTLIIFYEDLFEKQPIALQDLGKFLKLEELSFTSPNITKTNPENIRDMIQNYDAVVAALTGTKWEKYLD